MLTRAEMSRICVFVVLPGATTSSLPSFSAMNIRPSGAQATVVGAPRPLAITRSEKPAG